jgi:HEAT repeat protein
MLDDLLKAILSGDDQAAEMAVLDLQSHGTAIVPQLITSYHSDEIEKRWWAIRALSMISDEQARNTIKAALKDRSIAVQQCAALALREQPSLDAIPELIEFLGSKDPLLARLAGDALIASGENATDPLLSFLERAGNQGKREAIRALALIGDRRSIGPLFNMIENDSALAEYWAEIGLDKMGVGMAFFNPNS